MVKSNDREYLRSIEIGRANQRLWPRVKRWCRHIDMELTSSGMLAQAVGLPIGHIRVVCPHGHSNMEAMQLEWVAASFIRQNCIGCSHHDEISADNYGRDVIAATECHEAETKEAENRRKQLKAQAYEAAANALESGKPTEESVNRFILDLFGSDEEAGRAKDLLVQAADLGPELFSDAALRVMADAFAGPHTSSCIEAARIICRHRKSIPGELLTFALQAVGQNSDVACGLLCDAIESGQDVAPIFATLSAIVALPGYGRFHSMIGATHKRPTYPCSVELLTRLLKTDAAAVRAAFAERLKNPEKMIRYNAIELLTDLLPDQASHILVLADQLLHSLELPDDIYEGASADGAACRILAHLYAFAPQAVEARFQAYLSGAIQEVRALVLDIYSKLALMGIDKERHRWADYRGFLGFEPGLYARHASQAIDRFLLAVGDLALSPDQRFHICDDLKRLIACYPGEGLARIDRILGRLTMTCREAHNPQPPAAGPLAAIEAYGQRSAYGALKRILTEILEHLAQASPNQVLPAVLDLLGRLNSKDDTEAVLKAQLVTTLTSFSQRYELLPSVIRQLYKHLTDFDSRLVRARAIDVAGELLSRMPQSVPDDIIELLSVYLTESYVIIHQCATRALSSCRFQRDERGNAILGYLVHIERIYREEAKDFWFLRDAFNALRRSFRDWPEVRRYIALKLLPDYLRLPDSHFAEDMLVLMGDHVEHYPELETPFLQAALDHLKATARDRYNDDTYRNRGKILQRLSDVSASALVAEIARLRDLIHSKAGKDPIDVIRLLEILSHKELHTEAATLAGEALCLVPGVKSHDFERKSYATIEAAERAECLVLQDRSAQAVELIDLATKTDDVSGTGRKP
jgi:hypothetical protein